MPRTGAVRPVQRRLFCAGAPPGRMPTSFRFGKPAHAHARLWRGRLVLASTIALLVLLLAGSHPAASYHEVQVCSDALGGPDSCVGVCVNNDRPWVRESCLLEIKLWGGAGACAHFEGPESAWCVVQDPERGRAVCVGSWPNYDLCASWLQ